MAVERSEVTRIAALAKLRLDDHEIEQVTEELNDILEHCRALQRVELSEEDHGLGSDVSAPERVPGALVRDELALSLGELAPSNEEGLFLVPRLPALDGDAREHDSGDGAGS